MITLYIWFFVSEKNESEDGDDEEEEEVPILPSQVMPMFCDIMQNKALLVFLAFMWLTYAPCAID